MNPTQARKEFYEAFIKSIDRPAERMMYCKGAIAFPSNKPGRFHTLEVLPYIGRFDPPHGTLIPRIHLDHYFYAGSLSRAAMKRLNGHQKYEGQLELTVTMEELMDFALWVVSVIRSRELIDSKLVDPPPHSLSNWSPMPFAFDYAWSVAADAAYLPIFEAQKRAEAARHERYIARKVGTV